MFQFPNLFPRYQDPRAATAVKVEDGPNATSAPTGTAVKGGDGDGEKPETLNMVQPEPANGSATATAAAATPADVKPDIKPDVKPSIAGRPGAQRPMARGPPEGQVGKLVVMKSGKVKMIMGDDIVMNVRSILLSTILGLSMGVLPAYRRC